MPFPILPNRLRLPVCALLLLTSVAAAQNADEPPTESPPQPEATAPAPEGQGAVPADVAAPPDLNLNAENISVAGLKQKREEVQQTTALEDPVKNRILSTLDAMIASREARNTQAQRLRDLEDDIAEAPGLVEVLKKNLAEGDVGVIFEEPATDSSEAIGAALTQVEADLKTAQARLDTLMAVPETREARRAEIPQLIAEAKQEIEQLDTELAAMPTDSANPELARLDRLALELRKEALQTEIRALESELQFFSVTEELNLLRRDRMRERLSRLEEARDQLEDLFTEAKRREDAAAAAAAREALNSELLQRYGEIREVAENTQLLLKRRAELTVDLEQYRSALEESRQTLEATKDAFVSTRRQVETFENSGARLARAIGLGLRSEKENLIALGSPAQRIQQRQGVFTEFQVERLQLEDAREDFMENRGRRLNAILDRIRNDPEFGSRQEMERAVQRANAVFNLNQELFDGLLASYRQILDVLFELNRVEVELAREIENYRQFIDERILWIRSSTILDGEEIRSTAKSLGGVLERGNWVLTWRSLLQGVPARLLEILLAGLLALSVVVTYRWRRAQLQRLSKKAASRTHVDFGLTLRAFGLTLWAALPLPLLMILAGDALAIAAAETSFPEALGQGLVKGAILFFPLYLIFKATQAHGLGPAHLGWPAANVQLLRKHTRWFMPAGVLVLVVVQFVESLHAEEAEARVFFPLWLLLLAVYLFILFRPKKGLAPFYDSKPRRGNRWQGLRPALVVAVPALFALASVSGYHYTAWQLTDRLILSFLILIGAFFLAGLALNWIYLSRRRIASQLAKEKRALQQQTGEDEEQARQQLEALEAVDLSEVKNQTHSLLNMVVVVVLGFSLWSVWSDVLPALNILDRVELWQVEVAGDGQPAGEAADGAEGAPAPTATTQEWVTLADLALASLIVAIAWMLTRNLAGLFGVTIFRLIKTNPGGSYALTTISKYIITLIAVVMAFGQIGITWGTVQWLAAAISLGIGFGLQEIVANFVSGIIILFERPIRVGDIVTVSNVTGKVSKIRIRATTITDWDNKELIVPNREFITSQVLNWTLSEARVRLVIPVGVAYGSDVRKARQIMLDLCRDEPRLLDDPAPSVTFESFGDSTLDLVLRVHLPNLDNMLAVRNDMHLAIDDAFKKAGIEIAFPQRDLHLRSISPELGGVFPVNAAGQPIGPERGKQE